jgi:hypothetical protein
MSADHVGYGPASIGVSLACWHARSIRFSIASAHRDAFLPVLPAGLHANIVGFGHHRFP